MSKQSNNAKTNEVITVKTIYDDFKNATVNKVVKVNFSDTRSQMYTGFDDFSVNMKKSSFNVYMSKTNVDICKSVDKTLIGEINASDTTKKKLRSWLIRFTDYELLKKCILAVANTK